MLPTQIDMILFYFIGFDDNLTLHTIFLVKTSQGSIIMHLFLSILKTLPLLKLRVHEN